uniref:Uncharacterized protein n=1 Tax=Panagrolaimus superbus TaxID=310955 RepID=A0A914YPD7_9BILA
MIMKDDNESKVEKEPTPFAFPDPDEGKKAVEREKDNEQDPVPFAFPDPDEGKNVGELETKGEPETPITKPVVPETPITKPVVPEITSEDVEMSEFPAEDESVKLNEFQLKGLKSINFRKTLSNRFIVSYDTNYIYSMKLSHGFAQATGFTQGTTVLNNQTANDLPSVNPFYSHICIHVHGILRPFNKYHDAEIAIIPVQKEKTVYSFFSEPLYFKVEKTFVNTICLEFKDFLGNPIVCDRANCHFVLQFVKKR